jgi:hypothetical protein
VPAVLEHGYPGIHREHRPLPLRLRAGGKDGELIEYPWHLNPNHTPEWFARQKEKSCPWEFARFILMDFHASVADRVYDIFDDCPISEEYDYRDDLPLATAWDFGGRPTRPLSSLSRRPVTQEVFVIDEFEKTQATFFSLPSSSQGPSRLIPNPYRPTKEEQEILTGTTCGSGLSATSVTSPASGPKAR